MATYWGDLHCHCAVSYGNGTAGRALENAQQHLDFCSITGHAFWPDMSMDLAKYNASITMHLAGFAKLKYYWQSLMNDLRQANVDGKFVTLPSYEWHSMEYGDYNCYFDDYDVSLLDAPKLELLAEKLQAEKNNFMMLPHHIGYKQGCRGINWDAFDERVSPLIEIYSNHGSAEADDAPYEYHHSMGPRMGESMARQGLLAGHRFGFIGSTDNHDGYPGHYGHGRVGVVAPQLDRKSIWQALTNRRTIATTGARICADVHLAGGTIGDVVTRSQEMPLNFKIEGTAPIDKVEIIESSGDKWRVRRLSGTDIDSSFQPGRYKIKIETGWGIGDKRSQWHIKAKLKNGKILSSHPYFRYSGYEITEEHACDRILESNDSSVEWKCITKPNPAGIMGGTHFNAGGTQAMVLEVQADSSTVLEVGSGDIKLELPITELSQKSFGDHVDGLYSPALKIHRAVPMREFIYHHEEMYQPLDKEKGFLYLRITQTDGQIAWVSPIWFDAAGD